MSFKVVCEKCGNERKLGEVFELFPNDKETIDISSNIYEEILVYCPKCENGSKGKI